MRGKRKVLIGMVVIGLICLGIALLFLIPPKPEMVEFPLPKEEEIPPEMEKEKEKVVEIIPPTPPSTPTPPAKPKRGGAVKVVKITGPGDAIFNFAEDGYWWPGRKVEKWVEVRNGGNLPFEFWIEASGQDPPSYDAKGDGANTGLKVSFPEVIDIDNDDQENWQIKPGSFQKVLIRVYFPTEADNTCQGDQWELTFIFQAIRCWEK